MGKTNIGMITNLDILEDVINLFETQLNKKDNGNDYYHLVIDGEFSRKICDKVEEIK